VLGRAPREADGTTLRLGRASLEVDRDDAADPDVVAAFVALAGVRAPGGTLEIDRVSGDDWLRVDVGRAEQAAPLAREIVTRLTRGRRRAVGIDAVEVALAGAPSADAPPVTLRDLSRTDGRLQAAVLDAAVELAARRPRVAMNGAGGELRPRARGVADAGAAWREAAAALDLRPDERHDVRLYVDVDARAGDRPRPRPVLSGPADARPERALALLRAFGASSSGAFVSTDLSYAQARAPRSSQARAVAVAARGAGVRRLALSWPAPDTEASPGDDGSGSGPDAEPIVLLEDRPSAVLGLVAGVARARRLGIDEVRWTREPGDEGELRIAPPRWVDSDTPVTDHPGQVRRFARAVRAIRWPGTAGLALPLGRGTCAGFPGAQGVARIVSTSDGRARETAPVGDCTRDDAVRAAARAWNQTAR
jgi:hypothetical protein